MRAPRILSVAPRYRPGVDGAQGGHYTIYQDDLRAAAGRLGLDMVVLTDRATATGARVEGVAQAEGVEAVLDTRDATSLARSAAAAARPQDLVMVYEGSRALVEAFVPVAAARPDVRFVVNLFRPEPGLAPEPVPRRGVRRPPVSRVEAVEPFTVELPENLVVAAETDARVALAQRLGIPCAGAWRLHTTLWDVEVDPVPTGPQDRDGGPVGRALRVLVPLADRGYSADLARDLATVLHLLRHHPEGRRVRLTLTAAGSAKFSARIRGPRLEALGAVRVASPAGRQDYAALFASHDVIWIPNADFYRSQSSGKALDALAVGRPVMAPSGTWPAAEASRWTGEQLTYRDASEAARLLLGLLGHAAELHRRLADASDRIRAAYAPESTLLRVLELAGATLPNGAGADHPAPEPLPRIAPRDARGAWAVDSGVAWQASWGRVLTARAVGRRAARIGWWARAERRLRRRLARVRTRGRPPQSAAGEP